MTIKLKIDKQLSQEHKDIFKEFFDQIDEDKSGYLTREEMFNALVTIEDEDLDQEMID
jgi:Ca2+-binding EF-hand superfamily protein